MTTAMILAKQPAILPLYMACLLKKTESHIENQIIQDLTLRYQGCKINNKRLIKFKRFYGLPNHDLSVPATFILLLVFRPQLKFLLNKSLPFPVMGLVHMFNDIIIHREVNLDDKLDIEICVKDFVVSKKGKELTLHTRVNCQGLLVWESFSGYLYPNKQKAKKPTKSLTQHQEAQFQFHKIWSLPSNLGRQFALLSGDANPIHTYKLAAKLFGFKQAIAHGMCMALKSGSELQTLRSDPRPLKRLYVEFKKPVFLPNSVDFMIDDLNGNAVDFRVASTDGKETTLLKGYAAY